MATHRATSHEPLHDDLTSAQRDAVLHETGPLLIVAGAGTGKTTVITRRIAWLIATKRVRPEEILALTFTDKAAAEMEERVDGLVPYGYTQTTIKTFHAFGDQLLRDHAVAVGLSPNFRVLSRGEQLVFLRQHLFELPLEALRPLNDPERFLEALVSVIARAKDEMVTPEAFMRYATTLRAQAAASPEDTVLTTRAQRWWEIARCHEAYQRLLREADAVDFGDQVLLAIQLLEREPELRAALQQRFRCILVDEFQDTNAAQFRLLQLLAPPSANVTVVGDDDQSIYKWRGAAISNVLKFLESYPTVQTIVLTENFRSPQALLDCAYRLIRFNDPDRLEVRQGIDKRLVAHRQGPNEEPHLHVFDTASSEADGVARTIREAVEAGIRRPSDFAILVRSNREAELHLRALNVAGVPWSFSGASGLFYREECKMLLSCLKTLADPEDSLSWYHVASSTLYRCPMEDLAKVSAHATRTHQSLRAVLEQMDRTEALALSEAGGALLARLPADVRRLLELSRTRSAGQLLYQWLADRGLLMRLARAERTEDIAELQTVGRFFEHLRRLEELVGPTLPEVVKHLELLQTIGNEPLEEDDAWADRVQVLTIHKAKGLEFPVVFMVGLIQGRFPTPQRRDPLELPEPLVRDILPSGDHHLQEERRLFYVGMTRAQEVLHLTAAYDYGGKTVRKVSQFVSEALALPSPSPIAKTTGARALIERSNPVSPLELRVAPQQPELRLTPHGVDDYLTCPLKYRYSHILRIPVLRHHLVAYGNALHKTVEAFFRRRLQGGMMEEPELLATFESHWSAEGFLTREHEELRLAQGKAALRTFFAQQQTAPESPALIEEPFRFPCDELLVTGRWDRVDRIGEAAVIIDYKSSEIRDQEEANRRTRDSLQMLIYALAWRTLHGRLPIRLELRFLDTGLIGCAQPTEEDLERARAVIRRAAAGIRSGGFPATPQEHTCRWCAFQAICPFAFQTVPAA